MNEKAPAKSGRPDMPAPLAALYVMSIAAAGLAVVVLFTGPPPVVIGWLVGVAVGAFVPTLVTHAVVSAIYDLRWRK